MRIRYSLSQQDQLITHPSRDDTDNQQPIGIGFIPRWVACDLSCNPQATQQLLITTRNDTQPSSCDQRPGGLGLQGPGRIHMNKFMAFAKHLLNLCPNSKGSHTYPSPGDPRPMGNRFHYLEGLYATHYVLVTKRLSEATSDD